MCSLNFQLAQIMRFKHNLCSGKFTWMHIPHKSYIYVREPKQELSTLAKHTCFSAWCASANFHTKYIVEQKFAIILPLDKPIFNLNPFFRFQYTATHGSESEIFWNILRISDITLAIYIQYWIYMCMSVFCLSVCVKDNFIENIGQKWK